MKKSKNYRSCSKRVETENGKPVTYLDSNIDTYELQRKVMKAGSKGSNDPRKKENAAVNQAMYLARKYNNNPHLEYNNTVSSLIKESALNKKVQPSKDIPQFSGKYAYEFTFNSYYSTKDNIQLELDNPKTTKTRAKKLRKQLRDINSRIEVANDIKATL
jgi:hypothetical protein